MKQRALRGPAAAILTFSLVVSCGGDAPRPPENQGGEGGDPGEAGGSGGAGGSAGSGGSVRLDAAVSPTGNGGSGGTAGTGGSGSSGTGGSDGSAAADGSAPDTGAPSADGGDTRPPPGPSAPGQGPTALGSIVYSQDFESGNHEGITRSPNNLPADRVQVVEDPLGQRGKVLRVVYMAGDNFRTSPGTQPRNWVSNRQGNEFKPGENMSHAFGIMVPSSSMNYAFGQVISSGGPVWMLIGGSDGTLTVFCNTCGGNTRHMQIEPNKWYDFRVDLDFKIGGPVNFFLNGQMFRQGRVTSTRGTIAHWDGGIYNRAGGGGTRTIYISNLSVGKQ